MHQKQQRRQQSSFGGRQHGAAGGSISRLCGLVHLYSAIRDREESVEAEAARVDHPGALRAMQSAPAALPTALPPFHLAIPVHSIEEARRFYTECVRASAPGLRSAAAAAAAAAACTARLD